MTSANVARQLSPLTVFSHSRHMRSKVILNI